MKVIGYRIFALVFYLCRIFPIKKNHCFLVMTHDTSPEGNVGAVEKYLKHFKPNVYEFHRLRRKDTDFFGEHKWKKVINFFLVKPYELATSKYIFLDNIFLPMAYLKFNKDVKIVQFWHGTGTIKKFGSHSNSGPLKVLENKANQTITHLVVNSDYTRNLYQQVFSVSMDKVYLYGMPRTDYLFNEKWKEKKRQEFYDQHPNLKDKKLVLYAPTFRDHQVNDPKVELDTKLFTTKLDEDYCLLLRLHPHVADVIGEIDDLGGRVLNVTNYHNLNTLLCVADILVTDYSSIVFEYSILKKPMIFYAYDLAEFETSGRGFYEDYTSYVPGPVVKTTQELIEVIKNQDYKPEKLEEFFENSFAYEDGKSIKRFVEGVMK